jgi:succinate-acetate transporter protein
MAAYLIMWGVFTALMTVATLKVNRVLPTIFITLTLLFFMLAAGEAISTINELLSNIITTVAGYEGIFCGFSAIYLATAEIVNESYGKKILSV